MKRLIVFVASLALLMTGVWGCGKRPEDNPEFNPETAKDPAKIANPAEGLSPMGPPGGMGPSMPGGTRTPGTSAGNGRSRSMNNEGSDVNSYRVLRQGPAACGADAYRGCTVPERSR